MGKPSPAHLRMRELLTDMQEQQWALHEMFRISLMDRLAFTEEVKVAGHRIDFVVECGGLLLGVDVNGDRWHRWEKVRQCDVKKLNRVFADGVEPLVLGVWWSRLQSSPESVVQAIVDGLLEHRLAWWDWAVTRDEMSPASGARVASLLPPGHGFGSQPT